MKFDLHIHTHHSKCSNLRPETILKVAQKTGLDGIAVVDHDSFIGPLKVKKLNKDKSFKIILGQEITTNHGHLLAYNIHTQIKNKDLFFALDEIKSQGALAVIAHPFRIPSRLRFKYPIKNLKNKISAIEGFNGRVLFNSANKKAQTTANLLNLPITAGSDAHFPFEIGTCYTVFEDDLKIALKNKKTKIYGNSYLGLLPNGFIASCFSFFRKRLP